MNATTCLASAHKNTIDISTKQNQMKKGTNSIMSPKNLFNEYNLFLILEKHRISKLKELYHSKRFSLSKAAANDRTSKVDRYEGIELPKLPPRYQHLDLPDDWFVSGSKMQRSHRKLHELISFQKLSINSSKEWKSLDQLTKSFLKETVDILSERFSGNIESDHFYQLSSHTGPMTSVPVLSTSHLFSPIPKETQQTKHGNDVINEVDMSDDEIMSIWNRSEPSDDGVNCSLLFHDRMMTEIDEFGPEGEMFRFFEQHTL